MIGDSLTAAIGADLNGSIGTVPEPILMALVFTTS